MTNTPSTPSTLSVNELIAQMPLEHKVGQIMIIGIEGKSFTPDMRQMIEQTHIGGVILYAENVQSPAQVAQLTADLQAAAKQSGQPGLFICIDQEGGPVARLKATEGFTEFPSMMAVAAAGKLDNARQVARAMAMEMQAVGINMDLAPVLDVNNNPDNPIIGIRSFGSDPKRVAEFGVAFIEAMQAAGVLAVGKHFPGHGDTGLDSHIALPTVPHDRARLDSVELVPFKAAMKADVAGIMSAHITFPAIDPTPGLPATLSPKVLTGLLRDELKYDGILMTDSLVMGALKESGYPAPEAAVAALKAGADILLFHGDYAQHRQAHALIVNQVKSGQIPQARLDEAVRRVLAAKERFGILTNDQPSSRAFEGKRPVTNAGLVGTAELRALSRQIAVESITLLRDNARLLPLLADANPVVIETAKTIGLGKALDETTVQVSQQPTPAEISMSIGLANRGRIAIVATTDVHRNPQQAELVNALLKAEARVIVVAVRGPYDLLYFKDAPTCLVTYGSSPPTIEALADVIMGRVKPGGRLPVELPGLYKPGDGM